MAEEDAAQLKFRVDKHLRDQLEAAAKERGVSLNREISERLARSLKPGLDNSKPAYGILALLDRVMNVAGESSLFGKTMSWDHARRMNWLDDDHAYDQATQAATTVLRALKPRGKPSASSDERVGENMDGQFWAEFFLKQVATGKPNVPENQALIDSLRAALGPLTERAKKPATGKA